MKKVKTKKFEILDFCEIRTALYTKLNLSKTANAMYA
jgi:hypothetical protein